MIVPRYNDSVETKALPGVGLSTKADIAAFGGGAEVSRAFGAGQDLAELGRRYAQKEKEQADSARVMEAMTETLDHKNRIMDDPEVGVKTKTGRSSIDTDVIGDSIKFYDSKADEIEKGLANQSQVNMYRQIRQKYRAELHGEASKHISEQANVYVAEVAKKSTAVFSASAIRRPDTYKENMALIETALAHVAEDLHKGKPWLDAAVKKAKSDTLTGIVNRMIDEGRPAEASAFYKQNQLDIEDPNDRLAENVSKQEVKVKARANAEDLFIRFKDNEGAGREAADKMDTTGETGRQFSNLLREAEETDWQDYSVKYDHAARSVESGKGVPPSISGQLKVEDVRKLERRSDQIKRGIEPETDSDALFALKRLAGSDPQRFIRMKIDMSKFGKADRIELTKMQVGLASADEKTKKKLDEFLTDDQMIGELIKDVPKNDKSKLRLRIDKEINLEQSKSTKPLDKAQKKAVVDDLLIYGDYGLFGKNKRRYQVDNLDDFDPHMPKEDKVAVESALDELKIPKTKENLIKYYNRTLNAEK